MRVVVLTLVVAGCGRVDFEPVESAPMTIAARQVTNVSTSQLVEVTGGVPPYAYATDQGTIDQTGRFVTPPYASTSHITVSDAIGSTVSIDVRSGGDRIFVVGGQTPLGVPRDDVWTSTGGAFSRVGHLPVALDSGVLIVFEDRLFYLGGGKMGDNAVDSVYASRDGMTWNAMPAMPFRVTASAAAVFEDQIWMIGGWDGGDNTARVWRSRDAIQWTSAATLTLAVHEVDAAVVGGKLHAIGGHNQTAGFTTDVLRYDAAGWSKIGAAAVIGDYASVLATAGVTYRVVDNRVERSPDLMTWTPCADLPSVHEGPGFVELAGRLYVVGEGRVHETDDCTTWSTTTTEIAVRHTAAVAFTPN